MRNSYLSNRQVDLINTRCPYFDDVDHESIIDAMINNPDTTFVTITRAMVRKNYDK